MPTLLATPRPASPTRVNMAGLEVAAAPAVLETLLGSCVGIALWDSHTRRGGLAHIVLGESRGVATAPGKFADTAVAELRLRLTAMGCNPARLTAKIAGGATMFGKRGDRDVGEQNYRAVLKHLALHRIPLLAEHIGGTQGRIIRFALATGEIEICIGRETVATL